jgi:hypothetical protein
MKVFAYPPVFKFLYRFGNIPATILLSLYLIPAVMNVDKDPIYFIPLILSLLLIYFLNKNYINFYKLLPYRIEADEEKVYASDFLFSSKEVTIFYKDVESLTGGIFDGKLRGVMKVCDGKNKICIGFFNNIRNAKQLETLILSKVPKQVYDDVVTRIGLRNTGRSKEQKP